MSTPKKPPVSHGPVTEVLIQRTGAAAALYKDALKPKPAPKLTKKGAALQALVDAEDFGCRSKTVAAAFAILTGEPIAPKPSKPCLKDDHIVAGLCLVLLKEDHPYPAGVVLITTRGRWLSHLIRTDTGNMRDGTISNDLARFRFATPTEIRAAMARMPREKAEVLTWALLQTGGAQ